MTVLANRRWGKQHVINLERGLLGTGPQTPLSDPPRPRRLRGRFGIEGSNQEIDVESMLSRWQIGPWGGEGDADSRVGGGPVPNKPVSKLIYHSTDNDYLQGKTKGQQLKGKIVS